MNTLPSPVATWIGSLKVERLRFSEMKRGSSDFRVFCVFRGDPFCIVPAHRVIGGEQILPVVAALDRGGGTRCAYFVAGAGGAFFSFGGERSMRSGNSPSE